jgi:hypothetical protein
MIVKLFKEEVNNVLKELYERQLTKKRPHVNGTTIFNFFVAKIKKMMCNKNKILEDLALLIVKNHLPMHLVESQW